jgi:hypothetical protein
MAVGSSGATYVYTHGQWAAAGRPLTDETATFNAVSCPTVELCFAGSGSLDPSQFSAGGDVFVYRSGVWSSGSQITSNDIHSISCPRLDYCFASTNAGTVVRYSLGTWGRETNVTTHSDSVTSEWLPAIDCPTSNFCVAVSTGGYAYTLRHGTWDKGVVLSIYDAGIDSVSCVGTNFCIAVGEDTAYLLK